MKAVKQMNKWANKHSDNYLLDIMRITLGVFLFLKGVRFMTNSQYLIDILNTTGNFMGDMLVVHYVAMAHAIGGIMIVFGLLTRWAVAVQIPIIIGAVVINFTGIMVVPNLLQASLILIACVIFFVIGSGKHSVDYSLKMEM